MTKSKQPTTTEPQSRNSAPEVPIASPPLAEVIQKIEAIPDPRQAYGKVRKVMKEYRALGKPPPEKLIALERYISYDCISESQGR